MSTNTPNEPVLCVITARIKQTRNRVIKSLSSFDKTDYIAAEREQISCLKQNYDVTHFPDTDATDWPLSNSHSFQVRIVTRGYSPITPSRSVDCFSTNFSFGKDLDLLQQFMKDNSHIERFVINLFARVREFSKDQTLRNANFLNINPPPSLCHTFFTIS